jgi:hypothetical protein
LHPLDFWEEQRHSLQRPDGGQTRRNTVGAVGTLVPRCALVGTFYVELAVGSSTWSFCWRRSVTRFQNSLLSRTVARDCASWLERDTTAAGELRSWVSLSKRQTLPSRQRIRLRPKQHITSTTARGTPHDAQLRGWMRCVGWVAWGGIDRAGGWGGWYSGKWNGAKRRECGLVDLQHVG